MLLVTLLWSAEILTLNVTAEQLQSLIKNLTSYMLPDTKKKRNIDLIILEKSGAFVCVA